MIMPIIRPSSDLRNKYNDISNICHETSEPVYITKNGCGDLAVMSIEVYEKLTDKYDLLREIKKGIDDLDNNNVYSADSVFEEIEKLF